MSRKAPHDPSLLVKRSNHEITVETRTYRLITPLFGGGIEPQLPDPVSVVRGPSIRGHLRFWWRATRGGEFMGNLDTMRAREEEIWGSAAGEKKAGPSKVSLAVLVLNKGTEVKPFEVRPGTNNPQVRHVPASKVPAYAAFPLQPERRSVRMGMTLPGVWKDVSFKVTLTYRIKYQADVHAALWAWETFGGIGGRTRRGFGALQCTAIDENEITAPAANQIEKAINAQLAHHIGSETWVWHQDIPHLSRRPRLRVIEQATIPEPMRARINDPSLAAWNYLIEKLQSFRQDRPDSERFPAEGNRPARPGRSRWPEPDAIRRFTRVVSTHHAKPLSRVDKFPRAQFGLPIVFWFQKAHGEVEPPQTILQGEKHDRLASRLILRPLACAEGMAVALAIVLEAPILPPSNLILKNAPNQTPPVQANLTEAEASTIRQLRGNTDVIEAFLNTLKQGVSPRGN